jgi:hypothetical protein
MPTQRLDIQLYRYGTKQFHSPRLYEEAKAFVVIKLNETWYPYCEMDAATVQQLITAGSAGKFYNQAI